MQARRTPWIVGRRRSVLVLALVASLALVAAPLRAPRLSADPASRGQAGATYVTSVRIGHHKTFDRLVITFHGRVPKHSVRYVKAVHADASGKVIHLKGKAKMLVVVHPTSTTAHEPQGTWTPNYPEIRQVKGAGDFEGYTSYGVGLAAHRPFHAFTLNSPHRLVIDVKLPRAS